jgi:hypothetical protein
VKEVPVITRIALLGLLVAGCAGPGQAPGSAAPSLPTGSVATATAGASAPDASAASAAPLPPMPGGFPVHESMDAVEADGHYIAAWESDADPPRVYDFYLARLPAAGFVIDLEGPGGEAAIIRFSSPDGIAYQLDLTGRSPLKVALGPPHD